MYAEISAALQSVKAVTDIVKAAHSLSNYNELVAAVSDVNTKLMAATTVALKSQETQLQMAEQIAALNKELDTLRDQQRQRERYELHQFPTKALAYRFKAGDKAVPMHYLCARCFDSGKHVKLQPSGTRRLRCQECKEVIAAEDDPPYRHPQSTPWVTNY